MITPPTAAVFAGVLAFAWAALTGTPLAASRDVSHAALAQAARDATLGQIDFFRKTCEDNRRVEDWLKDVVGDTAKSIRWSGGRCRLVNKLNPLDGGTKWCGQAVVTPKTRKEAATIEVFFEKPEHGKPGVPFAFRAMAPTPDGMDYMRETYAFEVNWKLLHLHAYEAPANQDCD